MGYQTETPLILVIFFSSIGQFFPPAKIDCITEGRKSEARKKTTGKSIKWIICFSPVLFKIFFDRKAI